MSVLSRLSGSIPTIIPNSIATAKKQVFSINEKIKKLEERIFGSSIKLEDLPPEILFEISKHLTLRDVVDMTLTSRSLNRSLNSKIKEIKLKIVQIRAVSLGLIVPDDSTIDAIIDCINEQELITWQSRAWLSRLIVPDDSTAAEIIDLMNERRELNHWIREAERNGVIVSDGITINEIKGRIKERIKAGLNNILTDFRVAVFSVLVIMLVILSNKKQLIECYNSDKSIYPYLFKFSAEFLITSGALVFCRNISTWGLFAAIEKRVKIMLGKPLAKSII